MNTQEPNVKWFAGFDEAFDYSVELELQGFEPDVREPENKDIGGWLVIWF
jgi:hypothetical protein